MNFTYKSYSNLINSLKEHNYKICSYSNWQDHDKKVVILRHDIDNSISKALQLARLESNLGGGAHFLYFSPAIFIISSQKQPVMF